MCVQEQSKCVNSYHNESYIYVIAEMEDGRISTLLAALKLDENPLVNQFMFVEELNNADGSFILSVMIKNQIERKQNVILVTCHNSFEHFFSIGQKLGYNLMSLRESGHFYSLDILDRIRNEDILTALRPLKDLYFEIKKKAEEWNSENGVCIILENIGNFLLFGAEEFLGFINYLRAFVMERTNSSLVLSLHNFPNSVEFNKMVKAISHSADLIVVLNDLQTGRASDVTGHLHVKRKMKNFKVSDSQYQYQLLDKSIRVFAPGARNFFEN